jgi:hypothetical protein
MMYCECGGVERNRSCAEWCAYTMILPSPSLDFTSELSSARELRIADAYDASAETGISYSYHDGKQCSHVETRAAFLESAGNVLSTPMFNSSAFYTLPNAREIGLFNSWRCEWVNNALCSTVKLSRKTSFSKDGDGTGGTVSLEEGKPIARAYSTPEDDAPSSVSAHGVISNARKEEGTKEEVASARFAPVIALSCPQCSAPAERFIYLENGSRFPALRCSKLCGWWG